MTQISAEGRLLTPVEMVFRCLFSRRPTEPSSCETPPTAVYLSVFSYMWFKQFSKHGKHGTEVRLLRVHDKQATIATFSQISK